MQMSNGLKLMMIGAGTLITCLVVSIMCSMSRISKRISDTATESMQTYFCDIKESDIRMYDGLMVQGSDVVNLIKKTVGQYTSTEPSPMTITVINKQGTNSYTSDLYLHEIQNFTTTKYIKPTNQYVGEVITNANKVISEIKFKIQ